MADRKSENPHAIFIAYPLQGHLIPSVLLAIKLASKGFTITFINTDSIHHSITKSSSLSDDVFAEARKSGLDIRYSTVSDGLPISFDRSLNHDQFMESMYHVMSAHVDELVGNLVKSDPSITCLIADTFHFTNRKLVVDDWKIGINLCEGNLVERDGVTKKVKDLMIGEKSNELRFEMKKVQRTLQDALAIGGSSSRNFDQFVNEVKVKINQIK
nr:UDP-glycosyltransferase 86A1 [Tanacetum cinerariifolium]